MAFMTKLPQFVFKAACRLGERVRGVRLLVLVRLCGGVCAGVPMVGRGVVLRYAPHAGFSLGKDCVIGPGCILEVPPGASLAVGDRVKFTANVFIAAVSQVVIGDDSLFGEQVSIRDAEHGTLVGQLIREQALVSAPIAIGRDVWIGRNSLILQGVRIADGCIVGAHSLVKMKQLDAQGIYVGTPVRKVGTRAAPGMATGT
jgi:acetyltransferase-like isoleucine patch superfamily enzyme